MTRYALWAEGMLGVRVLPAAAKKYTISGCNPGSSGVRYF
jgi:hypothetical protein